MIVPEGFPISSFHALGHYLFAWCWSYVFFLIRRRFKTILMFDFSGRSAKLIRFTESIQTCDIMLGYFEQDENVWSRRYT